LANGIARINPLIPKKTFTPNPPFEIILKRNCEKPSKKDDMGLFASGEFADEILQQK
jgi:hypothetical protein